MRSDSISDDLGRFVCQSDMVFVQWRVVIEYNCEHHRTDSETWQRDNYKKWRLREFGYVVITVTKKDIFPDADEVVEQIRLQLIRKGWRPQVLGVGCAVCKD